MLSIKYKQVFEGGGGSHFLNKHFLLMQNLLYFGLIVILKYIQILKFINKVIMYEKSLGLAIFYLTVYRK